MPHQPAVPTLSHLMQVRLEVSSPQPLGDVPLGKRVIVAIGGGEFTGERLRGRVLAGGGDWLIQRRDYCAQLDARYALETHDGAIVYVQDRGLRHGPEHTMARLAKGEPVNPRDYYFRTTAQLETASRSYGWLNRAIVIGSGMREADRVIIDFYTVG